jgi:type II secretory pathway pseudopilin PulG
MKLKRKAFTLIETLVAITFSIIITTGVIKMVNIANDTVLRSLDRENTNLLNENILADLEGEGTNLDNYDGITDDPDDNKSFDDATNINLMDSSDTDITYLNEWKNDFNNTLIKNAGLKILYTEKETDTGETSKKYKVQVILENKEMKDFDNIKIIKEGVFSYVE